MVAEKGILEACQAAARTQFSSLAFACCRRSAFQKIGFVSL